MLNLLAAAAVAASTGACALLSAQEIAAVQGEAPAETKPGDSDQGKLRVSSCVFVLPTFARSVSLEVVRGEARQRWKELFHPSRREREEREKKERGERAREAKEHRGKDRGEEEGESAAKRVAGVGDEAFWLEEKPSGALYVLHKRAFLRLSIGGPDPRHDKLARAKALVKKALRRL